MERSHCRGPKTGRRRARRLSTHAARIFFAAAMFAGSAANTHAAPPRRPLPPAAPVPDARPGAAKDPRIAVENLLLASKTTPGADELARLARNPDEVLIKIASDRGADRQLRARAINALARTPTKPARRFVLDVLYAAAEGKSARKTEKRRSIVIDDLLIVRSALLACGWLGGPQAVDAMRPLLAHPDPEVRADAASGLALTRLGLAADLLRARVPVETDEKVRAHINRQLGVLEAGLGMGARPTTSPAN
jgi:HEAT repeats